MTQSSTMAHLIQDACAVPPVITGILVTVLLGGILLRGARGVGGVIQWLMPLLAAVYMLSAAAVILQNRHALPAVCCRIFRGLLACVLHAAAFLVRHCSWRWAPDCGTGYFQ